MSELLVSAKENVARVVLNRPEKKNALRVSMMQELMKVLKSLSKEMQVVVLEGKGSFFCSGMDLNEDLNESLKVAAEMFQLLSELPIATIAKIHGGAYAGGIGLIGACDIAYSSSDAFFCLPELRRGIVPGFVFTLLKNQCLPRFLNEMILTGEPVNAFDAHRMGLINGVFELDDLENQVMLKVAGILKNAPKALLNFKKMKNKSFAHEFEDVMRWHLQMNKLKEIDEGTASFLTKRLPKWE